MTDKQKEKIKGIVYSIVSALDNGQIVKDDNEDNVIGLRWDHKDNPKSWSYLINVKGKPVARAIWVSDNKETTPCKKFTTGVEGEKFVAIKTTTSLEYRFV